MGSLGAGRRPSGLGAVLWSVSVLVAACGDDARPPPPRPDAGTDTGEGSDACAACPAGSTCASGTCVCDEPLTRCGDACVDTRSSNEHCGACTTACAPGSPCRDGTCACAAPLAVCT
ncbi:MAG: hypothetical protein IT379_03730, partial [Deltaproteobacteria bacterium]|nr:hypothetical protein [Deltaproteobacteria bacterium]